MRTLIRLAAVLAIALFFFIVHALNQGVQRDGFDNLKWLELYHRTEKALAIRAAMEKDRQRIETAISLRQKSAELAVLSARLEASLHNPFLTTTDTHKTTKRIQSLVKDIRYLLKTPK